MLKFYIRKWWNCTSDNVEILNILNNENSLDRFLSNKKMFCNFFWQKFNLFEPCVCRDVCYKIRGKEKAWGRRNKKNVFIKGSRTMRNKMKGKDSTSAPLVHVPRWMGGSKSPFRDCLQPSKITQKRANLTTFLLHHLW
jgi:hypothetical protein